MLPNWKYRWMDNGPIGDYAVDGNNIIWKSGHLSASPPSKTEIKNARQINLTYAKNYWWHCGLPSK